MRPSLTVRLLALSRRRMARLAALGQRSRERAGDVAPAAEVVGEVPLVHETDISRAKATRHGKG